MLSYNHGCRLLQLLLLSSMTTFLHSFVLLRPSQSGSSLAREVAATRSSSWRDDLAVLLPTRGSSKATLLFAAQVSNTNTMSDLSSFSDSLEDEEDNKTSTSSSNRPSSRRNPTSTTSSSSLTPTSKREWQVVLEDFLDPTTPIAKRQELFSQLVSSNQDIRSSLEAALRNRSIDPLLTPRGKRLREGSRAVVRQITSDILPEFIPTPPHQQGGEGRQSQQQQQRQRRRRSFFPPPPPPSPLDFISGPPSVEELEKVRNRVWNAVQKQVENGIKTIQSDIESGEPWRTIPQRISQQSRDLIQEAGNVFAETPAGLQEPPYKVIQYGVDYEIRQYEAYQVASTPIVVPSPVSSPNYATTTSTTQQNANTNNRDDYDDEDVSATADPYSLAQNGAAFNTLASYLFGANKDGMSMEMTTPVTTTMSGEMRFYLVSPYSSSSSMSNVSAVFRPPEPLEQDESTTTTNNNDLLLLSDPPGKISIQEIPPALLAVRRFTGFCTKGEVLRQKEALLTSLTLDGIELDVPHGMTVPHVVFQYNPPYTLPVVRRNEIAVAVLPPSPSSTDSSSSASSP